MEGLVLLDKPTGITSFKAVATVRFLSGEKRIGHTGTLDPMATGVLPVLLGQATRLSNLLLTAEKRYTARLRLGITTDTLDSTGQVTSTAPVLADADALRRAAEGFIGEIDQVPPMYSALKQNGRRLYDLAREGVEVARPARRVEIKALDLLGQVGPDEYEIDVLCSKGTYIRSLVDDIGRALGCGAVLTALRRTMTAGFSVEDCVPLSRMEAEGVSPFLLPADRAVESYPMVAVTPAQGLRFCNGGGLSLERLKLPEAPQDGRLYRVYAPGGFLGMGEVQAEKDILAIRCIVGGRTVCLSMK